MNIFQFYAIGWTKEGLFWRKKDWIIRDKTIRGVITYQLRKVNSAPGKLDLFEADHKTLKEAMKAGNFAIRKSK